MKILESRWKMALLGVGALFVSLMILGLIVGPPPAKATSDNAVKACRSSSYAPRDDLLGSRSSIKPDGTWTPHEDAPGVYSMSQRVSDGSTDRNPYTSSPPWTCTASMDKEGLWTAVWDAHSGLGLVNTWHVKNADLRSVAKPRDLSGPGYGG